MKQWEIFDFPYPSAGQPHAFVIISNAEVCTRERFPAVNGLICTTMQGNRSPLDFEVVIDEADGMDRRTAVACVVVFQLAKSDALRKTARGIVTIPRRRAIVKVLNFAFRWAGI
jgi:hypothetical protein